MSTSKVNLPNSFETGLASVLKQFNVELPVVKRVPKPKVAPTKVVSVVENTTIKEEIVEDVVSSAPVEPIPTIKEMFTSAPAPEPVVVNTPVVEAVVPQREPEKHVVQMHQNDAELTNRLIQAKKIADITNVDISVVLQEMTKTVEQPQKKKQITFKKNAQGMIVGVEIVEEK